MPVSPPETRRSGSSAILRWVLSAEARHLEPECFLAALVERVRAEGLLADRMVFTLRTMHPEVWLESVRWDHLSGAQVIRRPHTFGTADMFSKSPVARIYAGGEG